MKTISALLFTCCFTLTAFGQQLTLNGTLMTDGKAPVPATRISVHGIPNTTDSKGHIYHEKLFEYAKAFELHRKWLESSPDDLSALPDFVETHFTTGRFAECERRIAALLVNPGVESKTAIALRAIEIANLLALDKAGSIPARIDALLEAVARQPADFQDEWSFDGTLHFIGQNEKLSPYREWLRQLFNAVKAENRDAIVKAVREAKAGFKW